MEKKINVFYHDYLEKPIGWYHPRDELYTEAFS